MYLGNEFNYGAVKEGSVGYDISFCKWLLDSLQEFPARVKVPLRFCYELVNAETKEISYDLLPLYKSGFQESKEKYVVVNYRLDYSDNELHLVMYKTRSSWLGAPTINGISLERVQAFSIDVL